MAQIRILHVGFRRDMYKFTRYFLLPSSHVAQGVAHPGSPAPPGRSNVRNNTTSPAAHPPIIAVIVKYILSLAAAVIARSAPPGIEVMLSRNNQWRINWFKIITHGFMAMLQIAWKTSAVCPVFTLTATGTCSPKRLQYTSGCTSCR
jgi:hypothetical protein